MNLHVLSISTILLKKSKKSLKKEEKNKLHALRERKSKLVDILSQIFVSKYYICRCTHRKVIKLLNKRKWESKTESRKDRERERLERVTHFNISIIFVPWLRSFNWIHWVYQNLFNKWRAFRSHFLKFTWYIRN